MTPRSSAIPRLMKVAGLLFTVASLAFAVWLLVRHGGDLAEQWARLRAAGWRPRVGWLAAALAVATANLFLLGVAWVHLLRALGGSIGYAEGLRVWTWTNLGRYLPGRVWQLSALTLYLKEKRQIGGIGLGSNVALQVLALATGAAVAFAVLGLRLAEELPEGRTVLVVLSLAVTVAGLAVALRPSMVARLSARMGGWMGEPDLTVEPRRSVLWLTAAAVTVSWFGHGLSFWLLWRGVGAEGGPSVWFWTGGYTAAYLIGYAALFAPAGLLVREGALATVLVVLGGVGAAAAAGIAILGRLLAVVSELLAAALAWAGPRGEPGAHVPGAGEADTVNQSEKRATQS